MTAPPPLPDPAAFEPARVLARTGRAGAEIADPWTPWDAPPDAPPDLEVAPDALQGAIDRVVAAGGRTRRHIRLTPGRGEGPVIVPRDAPPLTVTAPGGAELGAAIDAEMPGAEWHRRFAGRFAASPPSVRAIAEGIAARGTITTHNSAVLRIEADDCILRGLAVENTHACDRASAAPPGAVPDAQGRFARGQHQAVALQVAGADRVQLDGLVLRSFQDTLYLQHPGPGTTARTWLRGCEIAGDVDFIFGQATAFFSGCRIVSRGERGAPCWATAPATAIGTSYGFVFDRCRFEQDGHLAPGASRLGRQWFEGVRATPYGPPPRPGWRCRPGAVSSADPTGGTISRATLDSVGKCVVLRSDLGAHIAADPWDCWGGAPGSPRYRPAQHDRAEMAARLGGWLAREGVALTAEAGPGPWLGLFQCRRT